MAVWCECENSAETLVNYNGAHDFWGVLMWLYHMQVNNANIQMAFSLLYLYLRNSQMNIPITRSKLAEYFNTCLCENIMICIVFYMYIVLKKWCKESN